MKRKFIGKIKDDFKVRYFLFWIPVWSKKRSLLLRFIHELKSSVDRLQEQLMHAVHQLDTLNAAVQNMRTTDLYARVHHPSVFEKYKGIHRGKDIVLVGAGPTLDAYTPIPGAIHIGVNRTYLCEKLNLDYLFIQDGGPVFEVPEITNYRKGVCKKFFGVHPHPQIIPVSDTFREENDAERYYFLNADPWAAETILPLDVAHQPLVSSCSVVEPAFQFALWCQPRRIYIVGCDCSSNGYFKGDSGAVVQGLTTDGLQCAWQRMAAFAKRYYRDVEIVSINPVGLRGLFKDLDTAAEKETSQA